MIKKYFICFYNKYVTTKYNLVENHINCFTNLVGKRLISQRHFISIISKRIFRDFFLKRYLLSRGIYWCQLLNIHRNWHWSFCTTALLSRNFTNLIFEHLQESLCQFLRAVCGQMSEWVSEWVSQLEDRR